ncbi:MAG: hypothetical protein KF836_02870 [Fimbriimonadaceae bacterium]|nr:hypothetical protein [Fimbriimonadaceae bacterium]
MTSPTKPSIPWLPIVILIAGIALFWGLPFMEQNPTLTAKPALPTKESR